MLAMLLRIGSEERRIDPGYGTSGKMIVTGQKPPPDFAQSVGRVLAQG